MQLKGQGWKTEPGGQGIWGKKLKGQGQKWEYWGLRLVCLSDWVTICLKVPCPGKPLRPGHNRTAGHLHPSVPSAARVVSTQHPVQSP